MPKFHEYPKFIENALLGLGYEVDIYFDFSTDSIYQKYKGRKSIILEMYLQIFKLKILKSVKRNKYNKVLVIRGSGLDNDFFIKLKRMQLNSIFYMYQWDSIKNFNYLGIIHNFDKIYSFDSVDCINQSHSNINYIPLFFVQKGSYNLNKKFDVFFVGGVTLERYYWLKKFEGLLSKNKLTFYFYRYISPAQYINLLFKGKFLNPFKLKFASLNYKRMSHLFNNSKSIIDIAHEHQSGLTMRTFDALANYCKIVTNNSFIENEEFYNAKNIFSTSLKDLDIIDDISSFIKEPFVENHNIDNYHICEWLKKVLS